MPGIHRHGDSRFCGATTIVSGQSTLYINNKLAAVEGDQNTHGNGQLISSYGNGSFLVENKKIICAIGDTASADNLGHPGPPTDPNQSSADTFVYE